MPTLDTGTHNGGDHGAASGGAGHEGGNHGGDHGDHLHAHPLHGAGTPWYTHAGTIVVALVVVSLAVWVGGRLTTISHLEAEIAHLKSTTEGKADKGDVANLRDKLGDKADKGDVANLRDKLGDKADKGDVKHVQESLEKKADHALFETAINDDRAELEKVRQQVTALNGSYNQAVGKYDTLLNKHEAEVAHLRGQAATLSEKVAKLQVQDTASADDLRQLREVKVEKMTSEISAMRERIAALEATLKSLEKK